MCETIFPLIAGTDWNVIGLTCDQGGIPYESQKKINIAKRIIDKADHYGVALKNLHIDPCVMALATLPTRWRTSRPASAASMRTRPRSR